MTTLTISHTAENGTMLLGTPRDDGTYEVMREVARTAGYWRWSRCLDRWIVRYSRDRQPQQLVIDAAAKALREAGFDVRLHIDGAARDTAVAEADRAARQADRVEALQDKAMRKRAAAEAADAAHDRACAKLPSGGEPIKVGHHSEHRHRRAIEKARKALGRAVQADHDAAASERRAEAAALTTDLRYSPRAVAHRIDTLEAEQRADRRILDGYTPVLLRNEDGTAPGRELRPCDRGAPRPRRRPCDPARR